MLFQLYMLKKVQYTHQLAMLLKALTGEVNNISVTSHYNGIYQGVELGS